jgi:hypothetical protein
MKYLFEIKSAATPTTINLGMIDQHASPASLATRLTAIIRNLLTV